MRTLTSFLLALLALSAAAQPTWSSDIAPIIYKHCTSCHNVNGISPDRPLVAYNDVLNSPYGFLNAIQTRRMPPWPPEAAYKTFAHERVLAQSEIDAITDWANGGMLKGDTTLAPPIPVYDGIATIANPDLSVQIPPYLINTSAGDLYRCFALPAGTTATRFITSLEVLPGNRGAVHHVLVFQDTSSIPLALDAADPLPGYVGTGGTGSNTSKLITGWVPGSMPTNMPAGLGIELGAKANIVLQIHYAPGVVGQLDSTAVRFILAAGGLRSVQNAPILNHIMSIVNGPLFIAANTTKMVKAKVTLPVDGSFLSIAPHCHMIGRSVKSYAVTPTNDTIPMINIPEWDFNWQGAYLFPKVMKLTKGTTLWAEFFYDNTSDNQYNPSSPPQDVSLGESTYDEMLLVYFSYMAYQPGDENIVVDSTAGTTATGPAVGNIVATPQLYAPFPNPIGDQLAVEFFLPRPAPAVFEITDIAGKMVSSLPSAPYASGFGHVTIDTRALPQGTYLLRMNAGGAVRTKTLVK